MKKAKRGLQKGRKEKEKRSNREQGEIEEITREISLNRERNGQREKEKRDRERRDEGHTQKERETEKVG